VSLRCERKVAKNVGDGQCLTLAAVHDFISATRSFLLFLRKYHQMGFFNFFDFSFNYIGMSFNPVSQGTTKKINCVSYVLSSSDRDLMVNHGH
jgi:hypothetical protein